MIQSDALSRWPDFIPDKDTDNEDIMMLPDNLFIQLLDIDLQQRIANTHDHDEEVTKALLTMMEQGPHAIRRELGILCSLKERTISRMMMTYDETSPDYFMIMKRQATPENSKLITFYDNTTGGPDYVHMLKIMCMDAVLVNNSKSTDLHLAPLTFLLKGLNQHNRLQIVLWTLSQTCHQLTGLILCRPRTY